MKAPPYELLPWDTGFFGFKVARLSEAVQNSHNLDQILDSAKQDDISLIYGFFDPEEDLINGKAKDLGGLLVDEKITFAREIKEPFGPKGLVPIVSYLNQPPSETLHALSIQSGEYSRYRVDPNISEKKFEELYRIWMQKSLSGTIANEVFVAEDQGAPVGMITLKHQKQTGEIKLIGVDYRSRGRHIGWDLVQHSIKWCLKRRCNTIEVVTQKANLTACRFYKKCGFHEKHTVNVYHFWI